MAETGTSEPVKAGVAGVVTLVGVPVALVALAFTIVGIPLTIAGFLTFLLVLWVAFVYGALVAGTWLLSLGEYRSRWGALVVGLFLAAVLSVVPFGGFLTLLLLLVGLGAFALAALARRRGDGTVRVEADEETPGEARPS